MNDSVDHQGKTAAALSAVRECANTMMAEAEEMQRVLPDLVMEEALRVRALRWCDALKDTAQRVVFEVALLQAQSAEGRTDPAMVLRQVAGLDAAMMDVVAASTELVEELEAAAERDESQEPSFVVMIEMVARLMAVCESAQVATREIES